MANDKSASIVLSDKNFDPKLFLLTVHSDTSYKDYVASVQRLQAACEKQNEVTKNVVKQHFAKFVNAKGNIDSFYIQMRQKNLVSTDDYGIVPFINALDCIIFF
jgi:exocyst complex component 2